MANPPTGGLFDRVKKIMDNSKSIQWIAGAIIVGCVLISGSILYTDFASNKGGVGNQQGNQQPPPPSGSGEVSMDDDAVLGDENAPVTMVEFSDYQCPFCRKFFIDTLPSIKKDYIDTGKLKLVFRDYPLNFHPAAQKSAEAAECADEQGKYYQMHDKLFAEQQKQGEGTVTYTVQDIKKWAGEIGLNAANFNSCLDSNKYKDEVAKDMADGQAAGVDGTPGFLVGKSTSDGIIKEATLITGAQPYDQFKAAIDAILQ